MTIDEFDNTAFTAGMYVMHKEQEYKLASADFEEKLIGYLIEGSEDVNWARCENCEVFTYVEN